MKNEFITVNQLIGMLQEVVKNGDGKKRVDVRDHYGERIKPVRMAESELFRGSMRLEYLYFTEES